MKQEIGNIIKLKRIEKNITQEELAEGICTPSYLSRIENNRLIANKEIYDLLFERLGLDFDNFKNLNENVEKRIEGWYRDLLNRKQSAENVEELKQLAYQAGGEISLKFEIVYCRYLLINNQIAEASEYIQNLRRVIQAGHNRNFFLYTNVLMVYHHLKREFSKAVDVGLELTKVKDYESLGEDIELGIFYFNLALSYQYLYSYEKGSHFAKQALHIFNEGYYLDRAIDCQILLGICYNNLANWHSAIKAYSMAKRILKFLPEKVHSRYLGMIYNDLGYCYQFQEKYDEAIQYYLKSLVYQKGSDTKVITLINLIRCYYILDDRDAAKRWLNKAKEMIDLTTSERLRIQLDIFDLLLDEKTSISKIVEIQTYSINYFLTNQIWTLVLFYCKTFASYYEKHSHYKKASNMYNLALHAYEKLFRGGNKT